MSNNQKISLGEVNVCFYQDGDGRSAQVTWLHNPETRPGTMMVNSIEAMCKSLLKGRDGMPDASDTERQIAHSVIAVLEMAFRDKDQKLN